MQIIKTSFFKSVALLLLILVNLGIKAQEHPCLVLTKDGVRDIQSQLGKVPLFDASLADVRAEVDAEIALGILLPIPKDFSGGYTHERHKKNLLK